MAEPACTPHSAPQLTNSATRVLSLNYTHLVKEICVRFSTPLPGFTHVGNVADITALRRVFSGISCFRRTCVPSLLHTDLTSTSPAPHASPFHSYCSTSQTQALVGNDQRVRRGHSIPQHACTCPQQFKAQGRTRFFKFKSAWQRSDALLYAQASATSSATLCIYVRTSIHLTKQHGSEQLRCGLQARGAGAELRYRLAARHVMMSPDHHIGFRRP
ncbi:hypothetical protein PR048_016066 [Dryococelus australis]|uniref:Uncharacterized protein n=1 Tax=Dryococelus australis TaxID=614101 RepID=A0ABQ9HIR2_9NEOP|nr:hypothetical protein PR048_016066 [Dryococelus australis]